MFPLIAFAQNLEGDVASFMERVFQVLLQPFIGLLFTIALVMFLYGMMRSLGSGDKSSEDATKGRQHMLWGILGMFVMISVFGIMRLILSTLGIDHN